MVGVWHEEFRMEAVLCLRPSSLYLSGLECRFRFSECVHFPLHSYEGGEMGQRKGRKRLRKDRETGG